MTNRPPFKPGSYRNNSGRAAYSGISRLRAFVARRTRVARIPYIGTEDVFRASDCGRLGRHVAGHPWSALRVAKSCRKGCPTAEVLPRPKQQLCIQNGTRAHYLNYLQKGRVRRGKETQAIGLANQSDRQKRDGQTGRNQADERWYLRVDRAASYSGLGTLRQLLKRVCGNTETIAKPEQTSGGVLAR